MPNPSRAKALEYISYWLDDAGSPRQPKDMPETARLVAWQCGFEPLIVAVWSYLSDDIILDSAEAEDIAADYLEEIGWFADGRTDADYVL